MQCPAQREPWLPGSVWIRHFCAFCSLPKRAMEHIPRTVVRMRGSASEICKGCLNKPRLFNLEMRLWEAVTAISQWLKGCHGLKWHWHSYDSRGRSSWSRSKATEKKQTSAQCRELPNMSIVQECSIGPYRKWMPCSWKALSDATSSLISEFLGRKLEKTMLQFLKTL